VGRAVKRKHGKVSESIILQVLSYIPFLQPACLKERKKVFFERRRSFTCSVFSPPFVCRGRIGTNFEGRDEATGVVKIKT
jgi:hypothetical protein